MKNNKGITMISLVITVIILIILSSLTLNVGTETYKVTRVENFVAQLKIIQSKVDDLTEEIEDVSSYDFEGEKHFKKLSSADLATYNSFVNILENPSDYHIDTDIAWQAGSDDDANNYYYFTPEDLVKLGLKKQDITVIINFQTRNVIAKEGVKYENKKYYRQYDLPDGDVLKKSYLKTADFGYVTRGLVLHYDGIDNIRGGHSSTTTTWTDLSGNKNHSGEISNEEVSWAEDGLHFQNSVATLEIASDTLNSDVLSVINGNEYSVQFRLSNYEYNDGVQYPTIIWSTNDNFSFYTDRDQWTYFRLKNNSNDKTDIPKSKLLDTTITIVFDLNNRVLKEYADSEIVDTKQIFNQMNINNLNLNRYDQANTFTINNLRIYKCALTDEEIEKNYKIDQGRFGT